MDWVIGVGQSDKAGRKGVSFLLKSPIARVRLSKCLLKGELRALLELEFLDEAVAESGAVNDFGIGIIRNADPKRRDLPVECRLVEFPGIALLAVIRSLAIRAYGPIGEVLREYDNGA